MLYTHALVVVTFVDYWISAGQSMRVESGRIGNCDIVGKGGRLFLETTEGLRGMGGGQLQCCLTIKKNGPPLIWELPIITSIAEYCWVKMLGVHFVTALVLPSHVISAKWRRQVYAMKKCRSFAPITTSFLPQLRFFFCRNSPHYIWMTSRE